MINSQKSIKYTQNCAGNLRFVLSSNPGLTGELAELTSAFFAASLSVLPLLFFEEKILYIWDSDTQGTKPK